MVKFHLAFIIFLFSVVGAFAQSGAVKGILTDKDKADAISFANVILESNGSVVASGVSDMDGKYTIKPIAPGKYILKTSYVGYQPTQINNVIVSADKITFVDIKMANTGINLKAVEIVEYEIPLISKDNTQTGSVITRDQIMSAPTRDINSLVSQTAGVSQQDDGRKLNMRGQRSESTYYIIDGIKVRGTSSLPQSAIEQISVITGGVPAQYGDLTGGIINITTRGPSKEFTGGVELVSSQFLDKFGYNLVSINLSGPLWIKKDTVNKIQKAIVGFAFSAEFQTDIDANPSAVGAWKVKDNKLKFLYENPLRKASLAEGFVRNAEFLTQADLEHIAARQNVASNVFRLNGKLDYNPFANGNLTFGGSWDRNNSLDNSSDNIYGNSLNNIYNYSLLNFENNPQTKSDSWRVFGRFTQKFNQSPKGESNKSASIIKNAFYTFQVDYSKVQLTEQSAKHKDKLFDYGYLGKFKTYKQNTYEHKTDTVNGQSLTSDHFMNGFQDSLYTFQAADYNPIAANYTSQFYNNNNPNSIKSAAEVQNGGGLLNGDNPKNIYSLWNNAGTQSDNYLLKNNSQLRFSLMGSADIKNHAITVGGEFEKRIDRGYSSAPVGLWNLMRLLANKQIAQLDKSHGIPIYDKNGVFQNRVYYERLYNDSLQSEFDKNVRRALGKPIDGKEWIDIDSYDPSLYKLNMFSADELLNNGNTYVNYYGYDYTGNQIDTKPSFSSYFTEKDANGNYTRQVGAFEPYYVAGYIQDKFAFNDLVFNIGLRVDRYDANQKVLIDKYSLFPITTAGEALINGMPIKDKPSNIGDDYLVYTDDLKNPTKVVGYRHLDVWYNEKGEEISDPKILAEASSTGKITPLLVNPTASMKNPTNYNPAAGFKNYDPQYNFMPRIQFSFPISDEAQFFAHYDVLTQRPLSTISRMDPFQYLWLESLPAGTIINNPDLKPERTTDYELGFKQRISKSSALTLSTFYREMRDMIQVVAVNYAYPVSYKTYGNKDFGTVKGFSLSYDLRRTENVRLTANYTLQFADGTGSGRASSYNLITSGQPNLRTPLPLDFDQRHNIVVSFDYRCGELESYKGPVLFGSQIFANAGVNIVFRTGSGMPYTQQGFVTQGDPVSQNVAIELSQKTNLKGKINGSQMPWQFRMDAKIDKDFNIKWNKKQQQDKKYAYLNVYLQIQNVLNTPNIIKVYSYTGNPNDDGYLAAAQVQSAIASQLSEQSFRDLYSIKVNDPSNYSLPRRTRIGLIMNF